MSGYVFVPLPNCSICCEGFIPSERRIAHVGGEAHPFHVPCLQRLIDVGSQRDPIYGVRPILCPICRLELSVYLPSDPVRNPAPSVLAASNQLSSAAPTPTMDVSPVPQEEPDEVGIRMPEQPFDRLLPEAQIQAVTETFRAGRMDEASYRAFVEHLQGRSTQN